MWDVGCGDDRQPRLPAETLQGGWGVTDGRTDYLGGWIGWADVRCAEAGLSLEGLLYLVLYIYILEILDILDSRARFTAYVHGSCTYRPRRTTSPQVGGRLFVRSSAPPWVGQVYVGWFTEGICLRRVCVRRVRDGGDNTASGGFMSGMSRRGHHCIWWVHVGYGHDGDSTTSAMSWDWIIGNM